jgi:predicted helicase
VLSNAKCLTEGVDVPALDAVVFLNPRKSVVDVVQAVGRVMRKLEGKDFGYVILPIGIPGSMSPEEALRDNERYAVVWEVLQALRSHDERLRAEINKIDINKTSSKVSVIGIGLAGGDETDGPGVTTTADGAAGQMSLDLPDLAEWRDALYARIVDKVGDRQYMEHWAKDIADIATAQETRIRSLLEHPEQNPSAVERFQVFHTALMDNLNDGVSAADAISMLSQHLITRPVFEALFGGDDFTHANPVSQVMQAMVDTLDEANIDAETATLDGFYEHIRMLVGGIDSAEGRQKVIAELYEKFFKKVVPKTASSLGIVYTPVEIVDFINRAVNDLLHEHFDGASLSDEGVHVLDPFTGTGTFIARMIQSGLILPNALARKFHQELHANEIMLLAYYIAAINIETAFRGAMADAGTPLDIYESFPGIVLTDTFQMSEADDSMDTVFFPRNNARADRQKSLDIRVIVGNPPYSVGQSSQSDGNANLRYPTLDASIERSYSALSGGTKGGSLYDSYVRAIRWASNRVLSSPDGGVVAFVSNGGWLDSTSGKGIRHTLAAEFDHVYVFNLRGNARTSGVQRKKEADNVFESGSRNTVAITLLVRRATSSPTAPCQIHYRDIGDYLTRDEKLQTIDASTPKSIQWRSIEPNEQADWLTLRSPNFENLLPLTGGEGLFEVTPPGIKTNRDAWVFQSSQVRLRAHVVSMVAFYNSEVERVRNHPALLEASTLGDAATEIRTLVEQDPSSFAWNYSDFDRAARGQAITLEDSMYRTGAFRPFFETHLAFDPSLARTVGRIPELFPKPGINNPCITYVAAGSKSPYAVFAVDTVPSMHFINSDSTGTLARWRRPDQSDQSSFLEAPESTGPDGMVSNVSSAAGKMRSAVGAGISDDDVFHYVYGALHSPEFRSEFEVNLKKEAPRVPLVTDRATFDAFVAAGAELMEIHIGYDNPEVVEPYPLTELWSDGIQPDHPAFDPARLLVGSKKMRYAKVTDADPESVTYGKKITDKTRLIYNDFLTLSGIPERAADYVLGTRSGVDWIIDRWYVKSDKSSGIINDVNQWGLEQGNPRYIIDLIKRVVTVSLRTVEIVDSLPKLRFDENGTHVVPAETSGR